MFSISRFNRFVAVVVAVLVCGYALPAFSSSPLSGAMLDQGCRTFADKAAKYGTEWEQRQCSKKLNVSPQELDSDYNTHFRRCMGSVGTTIDRDLKSMESYLLKCRGVTPGVESKDKRPPVTVPVAVDQASGGDVWDLVVINSVDLGRSQQSYRIPGVNGNFKGANLVSGGLEFSGNFNGSSFQAHASDKTGYQANFFGRKVTPSRVEGTGCDNRNRSYSFTLIKRN